MDGSIEFCYKVPCEHNCCKWNSLKIRNALISVAECETDTGPDNLSKFYLVELEDEK